MRAGMTSCSEVAGRRSASATRSVVLNGSGLSSSGSVWRNSIEGLGARRLPQFLRANLDDAGPGMLAKQAERAPAEGQQHRVGGDGCVTHERGLLARIEKSQPQVVIRCAGGEHEGHLGMRELARDGHQGGVAVPVRVEDDGRGVSGEACACECVYLKNAQASLRGRSGEFCTHPYGRLHFANLGVARGRA